MDRQDFNTIFGNGRIQQDFVRVASPGGDAALVFMNFNTISAMKITNLFSFIFLFLSLCVTAQTTSENTMTSKIDSVTVFLEGAKIHRSGQLEVPEGRSKWVLKGL